MTTSRFGYNKLQRSLRPFLFALVCAPVLIQLAFPSKPRAGAFNTITVNSTLDDSPTSGNCTLREAIQSANTNAVVDACTAGAAGLDMIVFNVGTGVPSISPTSPLPIITEPVTINGNTGGATRIEINGTNAGADITGLTLTSSGSTLQALVINRFTQNGITLTGGGNTVKNCIIGLNPAATAAIGNGGQGISINNSPNNIIGAGNPANRNIISGNALSGVEIVGGASVNNQLNNNIIGTNLAGATGLGNSQFGVLLNASANVIGDGSIEEPNVISGNALDGVNVQGNGNSFRNNLIGTDLNGVTAVPNNGAGIQLDGATNSQIGGSGPLDFNLISGNAGTGILLTTNASNNTIQANLIGLQFDGLTALGNGSHGIAFPDLGSNNTIGGAAGLGNTIAFNNGAGISLFAGGTGNRITQNSIYSNAGLGIDLGFAGITANDNLDADIGPNNLQNFPVIASVAGNLITGTINTLPSQDYRIEFFASPSCDASGSGEGKSFLGAANVSTNGAGNATFTQTFTQPKSAFSISAVAIHPASGDTSEFSACFNPSCSTISLIPASLSNATTGSSYSQTITAAGGMSPYSFAVAGGNLPDGLTLTSAGLLSGTPTLAGIYNFTVTATDGAGCGAPQKYTVAVGCPLIPASINAPAVGYIGETLSYDVNIANPCPNLNLATTLTINTPPNTTFASISKVPGWDCVTPASGNTGTITCNSLAILSPPPTPNSPRTTFTIALNVNAGTTPGTVISHTANIVGTYPGLPPNTVTANGSTIVTAPGSADLTVTTTASPPAIAGTNTTFNINVTNNTAATTPTGVVLINAIPANTTFQSFTAPPGWTCATPAVNGTGTITCNIGALTASSVNFALTIKLNPGIPCDTTISNTASVTSSPPDPIPGNNSSTASLLSQAQSDLAINVAAPANAIPDVSATYTVTVVNNGPSASFNTTLNNALPAAFSTETINTSAGTCTGVGTNSVNCNLGTLAAGATATITIQVHVPETCQPTTAVNTATATTGNCLADPVAANNTRTSTSIVQIGNLGPGACIPSSQPPSAQKPGSVLFGGVFASGASGGPGGDPGNNTGVSLTNVHPKLGVVVHLFFVDGATCSVADAFVCLTPNQTTRFLMSDLDPGVVGYMMAMAVDGPPGTAGGHNTGCPISFNYLIGSARIKMTNSPRREAELASESCASEFGSPLPGCDPNKAFAEIPFDGSPQGFNKLPLALGVSNIASRADGNDTMLLLARVDGNWGTGLKPIGNIFGILYDDAENAYSFSFNAGGCLLRSVISNAFPRTAPRFEQVIPAGRSGWMRLWSADNAAIIGAIINRHPNADSQPNAFDGGHNLHVLRLNERVVVTVPVFPPSC